MPKQHKKPLNQKEAIKTEIRKYFDSLVAKVDNAQQLEPLSATELRDLVVPLVKKKMPTSYAFTPKLIQKWSQETSEQFFGGKIRVSHDVRRRKSSKLHEHSECDPNAHTDQTLRLRNKELLEELNALRADKTKLARSVSRLNKENARLRDYNQHLLHMNSSFQNRIQQASHTSEPRQGTGMPPRGHAHSAQYNLDQQHLHAEHSHQIGQKRKRSTPDTPNKRQKVDSDNNFAMSTTVQHAFLQHATSSTPNMHPIHIQLVSPPCGFAGHAANVHLRVMPFRVDERLVVCVQCKRQDGTECIKQIPVEHSNQDGILAVSLGTYSDKCMLNLNVWNIDSHAQSNPISFVIFDAPAADRAANASSQQTESFCELPSATDPTDIFPLFDDWT